MEVYAWGSGNYGRLGLGNNKDTANPQRVGGVLNGCDVTFTSCGWYHSAVVTASGDLATFGSKVTKCLGSAVSDSDASSDGTGAEPSASDNDNNDSVNSSERSPSLRKKRGRPPRPHAQLGGDTRDERGSAIFVPYVLRSFPSRVTIVQVAVGGDMLGAHTLAVSRTGRLYSWGYGPACGLGTTKNVSTPTLVTRFLGTGVGDAGSGRTRAGEMEPLGWGRHSHQRYRQKVSSRQLGLQALHPKIVKAVCGGGFSAMLSSEGEVFTCGASANGRLGFRSKYRAQLRPRRIETLREGTVDLAAGAAFVILCSAAGRLAAWGDNCKGQLGVGNLQESFEPKFLTRSCAPAFIFQNVAAGDSHTMALDSGGHVYSWGGEGGPMTGQGYPLPNPLQVDAALHFRLGHLHQWWVRPSPVRALEGKKIIHIDAGCLHSVALSNDGFLYAWGAPLQTGVVDNTKMQKLWSTWVPRLLAPSPRLPLVRVGFVAAGGWHSLAAAIPSCQLGSLVPPEISNVQDAGKFCDAYLISSVDTIQEHEARIPVCCAAVRARLADPDGAESVAWLSFSQELTRSRCSTGQAESDSQVAQAEDDDRLEDSLMEIVDLHRQTPLNSRLRRRRVKQGRKKAVPEQCSDADEAAGRARNLSARHEPLKNIKSRCVEFSSDSSSDQDGHLPTNPRQVSHADTSCIQKQRAVPDFSDDSSSSGPTSRVRRDQVSISRSRESPQKPRAVQRNVQMFGLSNYGEVVLTALVHFLHSDSLGSLSVIDEAHPVYQREQQLLMRPVGPAPGETDQEFERPTVLRAWQGLLLRKEIADLRHIGSLMGLPRLMSLCDQLLHRIDAPELPALFVPASTLDTDMWILLRHALDGPSEDGPDVKILCGPAPKWTPNWGHRDVPTQGVIWAHSFVVRSSCSNTRVQSMEHEPQRAEAKCRGQKLEPDGPGICWLRDTSSWIKGKRMLELDLQDVPADVVFAWLRYLYTHEDVCLFWPSELDDEEHKLLSEKFWTTLYSLALRLGDAKLQAYAQDVLVGALSEVNWAYMAMFSEQISCRILSEAAIMVGVRSLLPALLLSFKVPSGLEEFGANDANAELSQEQAATVGKGSAQNLEGTLGTVHLDLERHLLELRPRSHALDPMSVLALKRGSPAQFAELKRRLAEGVLATQRAAEQLQGYVRNFDATELKEPHKAGHRLRNLFFELCALVMLLGFLIIPSTARQLAADAVMHVLQPQPTGSPSFWAPWVAWMPALGDFGVFASGLTRVVAVNVMMLALLFALVWTGLKN